MNKEFIVILVITLIVGLIWAVSDIAHTKSNSGNLPDVKQYLDPITPNFDQKTLDKISSLSTPAPAASNLPVPSATASPSAQPSKIPLPEVSPTASASAQPK